MFACFGYSTSSVCVFLLKRSEGVGDVLFLIFVGVNTKHEMGFTHIDYVLLQFQLWIILWTQTTFKPKRRILIHLQNIGRFVRLIVLVIY